MVGVSVLTLCHRLLLIFKPKLGRFTTQFGKVILEALQYPCLLWVYDYFVLE